MDDVQRVRFGARRYPAQLVLFVGGGVGFLFWSRSVDGPMFLFPLGRVDAATAAPALLVIGLAALLYAAVISYVRFVRSPAVVMRADDITLPVGEFASRTVRLRRGDVIGVKVGPPRMGGWRTCRVEHKGGTVAFHSSAVPSDEDFDLICDQLRALSEAPAPRDKRRDRKRVADG
jgi:hypothetical protein